MLGSIPHNPGQAYVYTDATPFCGSVCHSMNPEFVSYQRSPHAHVGCAQCHVAPGPMGYLTAKMRGMTELAETIENDYPKPIPIPVTALYPIRSNCEECHWPANSFGTKQVHRVHFLADEHNTRWNIDMSVQIGGGTQRPESIGMWRPRLNMWRATRSIKTSPGCDTWIRRPGRPKYSPPPSSNTRSR